MAYKEKQNYELELKIDVDKGSAKDIKSYKVPLQYRFPDVSDGGADKLVEDKGLYEVYAKVNGQYVQIGFGGQVGERTNGEFTFTSTGKDDLLKSVKALPNGGKIDKDLLDKSMSQNRNSDGTSGGSDAITKQGITLRNNNLSLEQQTTLAVENNLSESDIEAQRLTKEEDGGGGLGDGENTSGIEDAEPFNPVQLSFQSGSREHGNLFFPEALSQLTQDYIKFKTYRYKPQTFREDTFGFESAKEKTLTLEGTCFLPVSGGVNDSNTVSWGTNEVNPIQAAAYEAAFRTIISTSPGEGREQGLGSVLEKAGENLNRIGGENAKKFIAMKLSEAASQTTNMLSRTSGAILNPNMVLLFQNAELRNFTFNYTLRPRNESEAITVRKIIRMFKQSMAVRRSDPFLFLLAPNVFRVSYHAAGERESDHKSIGKSKLVALKSCNVDYAPDGSYMTFNDEASTMTAYNMALSFTELEPIFYDDYEEDGTPPDAIGY